MNSRPTPITLSSERLQVLHVQLERIISRVILSGEHLRLLDAVRQAPASLDGLGLVLDDTAHVPNDLALIHHSQPTERTP